MLFSIPITGKETIVDTPLDCRSLRSFYFHDRYGLSNKIDDRGFNGKVTIVIGGKTICQDLLIAPFMDSQRGESAVMLGTKDWRRICVPCLKNCDMTEIKIITNDDPLDYEVVFEYSDVEVEREYFYHIESFPCFFFGNQVSDPFGTIFAQSGEEFQIQTHEEAEKIFVSQPVLVFDNSEKMESQMGYQMAYQSIYYEYYSERPETIPSPDYKITISDLFDVMPKGMPTNLISENDKKTWKEVVYTLNEGLSKHPKLTIDVDGVPMCHFYTTYFYFMVVIYFLHECNF